MELRFGRAGVFGALAYAYLFYELLEGHMRMTALEGAFHWLVVYWLCATAFVVGWQDHQNQGWVRLDQALRGRDVNADLEPEPLLEIAAE